MSSNNNNGSGNNSGGSKSSSMSQSDAQRIQSTQAKGGGDMTSGGFAARAQGAGDRNANNGQGQSNTGGKK